MSYSRYFKDMFERKHEGQPHYTRKWAVKNSQPTGLTDAQRTIAAPPDDGKPAAVLYAFFDISKYKLDWQPSMLQVLMRLELGFEYVELDNGFWYLLEEDGSYKHMTDKQFKDFLKWKSEQEAEEEEDAATDPNETEDEGDYVPDFEDPDSDDTTTPDSSIELLDAEIKAIDSKLKKLDSEMGDSS